MSIAEFCINGGGSHTQTYSIDGGVYPIECIYACIPTALGCHTFRIVWQEW